MRLLVALFVLALPSAALAQSVSGASAQAAPAATVPTAKPPGGTVSGVTVEGRKPTQKSCSSRDSACVAAVVAELKARYPKELQKWCDTVTERAAMTNMLIDDLNATTGSPGTTSEAGQFYAPAVAKVACSTPKSEATRH